MAPGALRRRRQVSAQATSRRSESGMTLPAGCVPVSNVVKADCPTGCWSSWAVAARAVGWCSHAASPVLSPCRRQDRSRCRRPRARVRPGFETVDEIGLGVWPRPQHLGRLRDVDDRDAAAALGCPSEGVLGPFAGGAGWLRAGTGCCQPAASRSSTFPPTTICPSSVDSCASNIVVSLLRVRVFFSATRRSPSGKASRLGHGLSRVRSSDRFGPAIERQGRPYPQSQE